MGGFKRGNKLGRAPKKRGLHKKGKKRNFPKRDIFQIDLLIHSNLHTILGLLHIIEFINYHKIL